MFHDVTGMMNGTAGVLSRKVCGFDREGGDKETDGFNPPAASFHRGVGDIVPERCRSGRSCRGGVGTCALDQSAVRAGGGRGGLIIINHGWGHMSATRASAISFTAAATCFPNGSERPRRLKTFRPSFCAKPNYLFTCSSARARLPECKSKLLMLGARVPRSGGIICTPSGGAEKTFKHSCLKVLHDQQSIQKLCRPIMK